MSASEAFADNVIDGQKPPVLPDAILASPRDVSGMSGYWTEASPGERGDANGLSVLYVRADLAGGERRPRDWSLVPRDALRAIVDDYITSAIHHPGYVCIPSGAFEALKAYAPGDRSPRAAKGE